MAEFGVPTAGQLEKINALAKRTLDKSEVFSFHTKMVGDALLTERLVQLSKPPGWLGELSGVWDGAYPTAGVLSKNGSSEAQRPFVLLDDMPKEDLKKVPSSITTYGFYSAVRGNAVTYFKKDDLVKGNAFTVPDLSNLKGGGKQVSEEVKTYTQEEVDALLKEAADSAVKEALAKQAIEIQASAAPLVVYMTQQDVVDKAERLRPGRRAMFNALLATVLGR